MHKDEKIKKDLVDKIEKALEKERMKKSSLNAYIELVCSDKEIEIFLSLEKYHTAPFFFEIDYEWGNDNLLILSYNSYD